FTIAPESWLAPGRINSLVAENLSREKRAGASYFAAPIRIMVVPQTGHFPCIAGLPFLSFTATAFLISRLARHFTQSPCTMGESPTRQWIPPDKRCGRERSSRLHRFRNT